MPHSKPRRPPPRQSNATLFTELTEPETALPAGSPLAARMRPRDLDEYVGQAHLVGPVAFHAAGLHNPHDLVRPGNAP